MKETEKKVENIITLNEVIKNIVKSYNIFIGIRATGGDQTADRHRMAFSVLNDFFSNYLIKYIKENNVNIVQYRPKFSDEDTGMDLIPPEDIVSITVETIERLSLIPPSRNLDLTSFSNYEEINVGQNRNMDGSLMSMFDLIGPERILDRDIVLTVTYIKRNLKGLDKKRYLSDTASNINVTEMSDDRFYLVTDINKKISDKKKQIKEYVAKINELELETENLNWILKAMKKLKVTKENRDVVKAHMIMEQFTDTEDNDERFTQLTEILSLKD